MKMKTTTAGRLLGVLTLALCVGCVPTGGGDGDGSGGDGTPNGGGFGNFGGNGTGGTPGGNPGGEIDVSDGNEETLISDLTGDEIQAFCEEVTAQVGDVISEEVLTQVNCIGLAIFTGIFDEDPAGACQTAYDACIASPPPVEEGEPCSAEPIPDCMVTIGQAEACLNAQLAAVNELASSFDCADLAELDIGGGEEEDEPAECMGLAEACPTLFGDDEEPFPGE